MVSTDEASMGWETNESRRICEKDLKRLREPVNLCLRFTSFEGRSRTPAGATRSEGAGFESGSFSGMSLSSSMAQPLENESRLTDDVDAWTAEDSGGGVGVSTVMEAPGTEGSGVGIWDGGFGNARQRSDSSVAARVREEEARLSVKEERWMDTLDRFLRRKRVDFVREREGCGGVVIEDSGWGAQSVGGRSSGAMSSKSPACSSTGGGGGCFFAKRGKARARRREGSNECVELRREPRRPRGSFDCRKLCADSVVCSQALEIRTCEEGRSTGQQAFQPPSA